MADPTRSLDDPDLSVTVTRRIDAAPPAVFAIVDDDETSFYALRPTAVAHHILVTHDSGGHDCEQVYEIKGKRYAQMSTSVEHVRGERMVSEGSGPGGTMRTTVVMEPAGDGTSVSVTADLLRPRKPSWLTRRLLVANTRRSLTEFLDLLNGLATKPSS